MRFFSFFISSLRLAAYKFSHSWLYSIISRRLWGEISFGWRWEVGSARPFRGDRRQSMITPMSTDGKEKNSIIIIESVTLLEFKNHQSTYRVAESTEINRKEITIISIFFFFAAFVVCYMSAKRDRLCERSSVVFWRNRLLFSNVRARKRRTIVGRWREKMIEKKP